MLGYNAQQMATITKRHLHLILVKLLEMYHIGFGLSHYYDLHKNFMVNYGHLAHLGFEPFAKT